jgi:hypothetical protein
MKIFSQSLIPTNILVVCSLYCLEVIEIMPANKNPLLVRNFKEGPDPDGGKSEKFTCLHCKTYSRTNSSRALEHLKTCQKYLLSGALSSSSSTTPSERPTKRQQTFQLGVPTLSNAKKQKLDRAAALAVYMGARPFALFDDYYMRTFVDLLSDSLYKALSRRWIGGDLLDKIYKEL